jgi:NADP-dependent 3-hydroxy-3-methylglutaryl-CoA reductase
MSRERRLPSSSPVPALPAIPARGQYSEAARLERLAWARAHTGADLAALEQTRVQPETLTCNIENMIGAVEVPVGIAGPLAFRGTDAQGIYYAPLATSEGALVASCSRGARAISASGGVVTRVVSQRMMRAPLFVMSSIDGAFRLAEWVQAHTDELRAQVREVSRHARLVAVEPRLLGRMVHISFIYETGDAAGQNMTTATTWHACQWMVRELGALPGVELERFLIEANVSGDKKVTLQSFLAGRGTRVVAECLLDPEVMRTTLKVEPEQLVRAYQGILAGSISTGMVGFSINAANLIAAVFTATGQDIACVHESSVAQLHVEAAADGIRASIVLPSLVIGTVGGGTHLPAQRALLELIDCAGAGKVRRFAEIIAGFCLALDLSTMSAVANGEFAAAHERLGRNRPVESFGYADLDAEFFAPGLRRALGAAELQVTAVEPIELDTGSSIISEITARKVDKLVGHVARRVTFSTAAGTASRDVVVKLKPLDDEVILMVNGLAAMCGPAVAAAHAQFRRDTGMAHCHLREIGIYEQTDPRFTRHAPAVYGTLVDHSREAYVVIMEKLQGMVLQDSADDVRGWTRANIEVALRGIAEVHAIWYGREAELRAQQWLGEPPSAASMVRMQPLWEALAAHAHEEFPGLVHDARLEQLMTFTRTLDRWWPALEAMPRTLAHNDFNPRNIALRDDGAERRLCAYDWELATLQLPQHDLAELLCFVLPSGVARRHVDHLIEVHRRALERAVGGAIDPARWREGYRLALRDLAINRFGLYLMAHTFRHYGFMERTVHSLWWLLSLERD